ncbi:MAG: hypothetical protein ACRYFV_12585, partial [Janthinobacterium lividum]
LTIPGDDRSDNVHGEFGFFYNWPNYRETVRAWIDDNEVEIQQIASSLLFGTKISTTVTELSTLVRNQLVAHVDQVANNQNDYSQMALSERLANAGYLPMFGFPTKVRVLYEKTPDRIPADDLVDRNLDIAISEFAPGSETIKDKKVLTAVGVVNYQMINRRVMEMDGRGVLPNGISRCITCHTVFRDLTESDPCTVCGQQLENIHACAPLGFCVDYAVTIPKDFDGNFEWSPRAGETSLDPDSKLHNEKPTDNIFIRSNRVPSDGIVHQINDNNRDLFELGRVPGQQRWVVRDLLMDRINLIDSRKYAFVSSRHTGVITLSLQQSGYDHTIDPFDPYIKAAFLSWAFLIRKSICDKLDIETNEFNIGYRVSPQTKQAEIYIVEKADNGAGYCNYLNGMDDLTIARDVFVNSLLPGGRVYSEVLMPAPHEKVCASSCYDCLRDYYNQQHHGLLNWRIALDLAGMAANNAAILDFSQAHWCEYLDQTLLPTLENKLHGNRLLIDGNYFIRTNACLTLLIHPFWSSMRKAAIKNKFTENVRELNVMDAIAKSKFY